MSVCLWADIDDYLKTAITADMGPGTYGSLEIATVLVGETLTPEHHTKPIALIRGMEAEIADGESGPHSGGEIHFDRIIYPYELIFIAEAGTDAAAKAAGQELWRRGREMLRSRYALGGLASTDGEHVISATPTGGKLEIRGRPGAHRDSTDKYLAAAVIYLDVLARI